MKKDLRDKVYKKFDGLCAYTGKRLDDKWQVDHAHPKCLKIQIFHTVKEHDEFENLLPCIGIINHYKRSFDVESFRTYMSNFHVRLSRLPKKTSLEKTKKRIEYMNKIAALFDTSIDKPFCGIFHFEKSDCG